MGFGFGGEGFGSGSSLGGKNDLGPAGEAMGMGNAVGHGSTSGSSGGGSAGGAGDGVARARDSLSGRRKSDGYQASSLADRRGLTNRDNTPAATAEAVEKAVNDIKLANKQNVDVDIEGYDADFRGMMARQIGVDAQSDPLGRASSLGLGLLGGLVAGPAGAALGYSAGSAAYGAKAQSDARADFGLGSNPNAAAEFGGQTLSNLATSAVPGLDTALDLFGNPLDAAFVAGVPASSPMSSQPGGAPGLLANVAQPSTSAAQAPYAAINRNIRFNWPT